VWVAKPDGTAYSANSLPQRFSGWATDAGLPDLSAHGLRKSVGTILADMGASENTIMAVLAHRSAGAAQIYVRGANRRKLAGEGMAAVEEEISRIWN
jgi:integrase